MYTEGKIVWNKVNISLSFTFDKEIVYFYKKKKRYLILSKHAYYIEYVILYLYIFYV